MNLSPRMEKLLVEQKKAEIVISVLVTILTVSIFFKAYTISGWGLALLSLPLMVALNFITNRVYCSVLCYKHYGSNVQEYVQELEEAADYFDSMADVLSAKSQMMEMEFETTKAMMRHPEKSIGFFLDAPIYEWMELITPNGEPKRYVYHSCIRPEQRKLLELAPDQIIIEPGIVYQVDLSVNIDA